MLTTPKPDNSQMKNEPAGIYDIVAPEVSLAEKPMGGRVSDRRSSCGIKERLLASFDDADRAAIWGG
jgi:hypothetical protein